MVRFSIVVPLLGNVNSFDNTLASVLRNRPDSTQIIVAHNGTYDDPYDLAGEVDFATTGQDTDLIQLFNRGLQAAKGEFVALLRPGIQLTENWSQSITDSFSDPDVGSVSPAVVSSNNPARLVAAGVSSNFKFSRQLVGNDRRINARRTRNLKPLAPTSWAAFYRRSLLTALGDCDEQLDNHYLDVDLGLSLRNLRFGCVFCPDCLVLADAASEITTEATLPHGKSAQRALNRQLDLTSFQKFTSSAMAVACELAASPLRLSNLKHASQRWGAVRLRQNDRHHWNLLSVLLNQRQRLVDSNSSDDQSQTLKLKSQTTRPSLRRAA